MAPSRPGGGAGSLEAAATVERIERQLSELASVLAAGALDVADYTAATSRLRADLAEASLAAAPARPPATASLGANPGAAWVQMTEADDIEPARVVLLELVEAVRLLEPTGSRTRPTDLEIAWRE